MRDDLSDYNLIELKEYLAECVKDLENCLESQQETPLEWGHNARIDKVKDQVHAIEEQIWVLENENRK